MKDLQREVVSRDFHVRPSRSALWKVAFLIGHSLTLCGCANQCWPLPGQCQNCLEQERVDVLPKAQLANAQRCVEPIPCAAVAAPPGTYVQGWGTQMAYQADQEQRILTRNLWFDGGAELGPDGEKKIREIAMQFSCDPSAILIEEEPLTLERDETLMEAKQRLADLHAQRRSAVVHSLASMGIADADSFVLLASDRSVGTHGIEAPLVFNRQFMGGMGGIGGNRGGMGGGLGGGLGGGGFGGGFGGGGFGGGGFGGGMGGGGFGGMF